MTEMQQQIIKWLANGETGTSSKTMAFVIGFDVIPSRSGYPHDVSDFRRCFHLVNKQNPFTALLNLPLAPSFSKRGK